MIRFFLVLVTTLTLIVGGAGADTRSLYTIKDIPVDEIAETVIVAQQQAFSAARLEGAYRIVERLTLAEDRRSAAEPIQITQELADRMTAAVDVQDEARGGNRYRGELSVVFNPREVRAYLSGLSIPYIDSQAPLALAVPIVGSGVDVYGDPAILDDGTTTYNPELMWLQAWGVGDAGALAQYVTSELVYPVSPGWGDLQNEVLLRQAQRAFTATLTGQPGAYRVTVETLTASGRLPVGTTSAQPDILAAAAAASELLSTEWKRQVVVRSEDTTVAEASVLYASLADWNTLRGALSRSPLVSGFQIRAVSRDGAVVNFAYASDLRRLSVDLRQRGVSLQQTKSGLVLTSANVLAIPQERDETEQKEQ